MDLPTRTHSAPTPDRQKRLSLALQGGGAHGAFTWGVLDRLLEEPQLRIEGISATSAGAMNAAVTAYGLAQGGAAAARGALAGFWRRVAQAAAGGPLQPTWLDRLSGSRALEWSPAFLAFDLMTRLLSPYQFNPGNINPLRRVLDASLDVSALRSHCCPVKLFLSATNVRTGKIKVFDNDELTVDALMACACLPFIFQAIEIGGEAYWDGGYMGNPAIFPLIYGCEGADVLIVHINPMERRALPRTAGEILNRINEISFNSSLMREMRAVEFVSRLIDEGRVVGDSLKRLHIHAIADDATMQDLSVASKLNADWDFLLALKEQGRSKADEWLSRDLDRVGIESTVDVEPSTSEEGPPRP